MTIMVAPEEFFDIIEKLLRDEPDRKLQDKYLDLWIRAKLEWDAAQWGFEPTWMKNEIEQLAKFDRGK